MHGAGGGLYVQGLKAHTTIGVVFTAERYGRRVLNSIWYTTVSSGQPAQTNFVLAKTGHFSRLRVGVARWVV